MNFLPAVVFFVGMLYTAHRFNFTQMDSAFSVTIVCTLLLIGAGVWQTNMEKRK